MSLQKYYQCFLIGMTLVSGSLLVAGFLHPDSEIVERCMHIFKVFVFVGVCIGALIYAAWFAITSYKDPMPTDDRTGASNMKWWQPDKYPKAVRYFTAAIQLRAQAIHLLRTLRKPALSRWQNC
jgi:hypothetical protein